LLKSEKLFFYIKIVLYVSQKPRQVYVMNTQRLYGTICHAFTQLKIFQIRQNWHFLHVLSVHAADSNDRTYTHRALAKMLPARKTDEVMGSFDLQIKLR